MKNLDYLRKKAYDAVDFSKHSTVAVAILVEICLGSLLILFSLVVFLKIGEDVLGKETISFDSTIIHFIYAFRSPLMTTVMRAITFLGGGLFIGSAIVVTIVLLVRKHAKDALIFSFILFFGINLNLLLKALFQRPRPEFMPLIHESSYSFPSGHSMNSFVFYMSLSYFIFRKTNSRRLRLILSLLSGLLVLFIGISRVYLGVHYPSDVLAGFIAGGIWLCAAILFEKTLLFLRLFREYEEHKEYKVV